MATKDETPTPPQGILQMLPIMMNFHSVESFVIGAEFVPSPTDVLVCTAPKAGSTWVQQICHGLRSGGDMSFDEISWVFPNLEMAHDLGYGDLQAPQPYQPRMYKTHMWYPFCPKGAGKYVILAREPADAAVSFYYFKLDWYYTKDQVSIEDFVKWLVLPQKAPEKMGDYSPAIDHITSWYPHRLDENVLWLHYEDLKQNLPECVRLIAEFLDIGKDDAKLQELVTHQATFEFMKAHDTQFDEHPIKLARNEVVGLPREAGTKGVAGKVRNGNISESKEALSAEILAEFDKKWKEIAMPVMGYATYGDMRAGINKELGRSFT